MARVQGTVFEADKKNTGHENHNNSMHNGLYIKETARWYSLLSQAQAATAEALDGEVESYMADMLFRFASGTETSLHYPEGFTPMAWNSRREERLARLQGAGERCLVTAGFFPEHANYAGLSLLHFIETGRSAYQELHIEMSGSDLYEKISGNFVQLVDILQKIGELSGVCRPLDLIQASELWQHEGSLYGRKLVQDATDAFAAASVSAHTH